MMIFKQEKLVFLAVPKTGTSAIEEALRPHAWLVLERPPGIRHMTLARFNRDFRPQLVADGIAGIEIMAVMREPVSWLGSWYRYRLRDNLTGKPKSTSHVSFNEFVAAYLAPAPRSSFAALGSQARQMSDETGRVAIDHLFRYEDFSSVTGFLSQRVHQPLILANINVSEPLPLELSPALHREYQTAYQKDFDLYDSIP